MKKIKLLLILFCTSITLFWSCETQVEITELVDGAEGVAIYSYISEINKIHSVSVTRVLSALVKGPPLEEDYVIKNAKVELSDGQGAKADLIYVPENLEYEIPAAGFSVVSGRRYFLKVTLEGEHYTASCSIPNDRIAGVSGVFRKDIGEFGSDLAEISFNDVPNRENYYAIIGEVISDSGNGFINDISSTYFTDKDKDGEALTTNFNFELGSEDDTSNRLKVKIINVEKTLFNQLNNNIVSDNFLTNKANPFVEPIVTQSNIIGTNSIGVFAGYQVMEKEIPIIYNK